MLLSPQTGNNSISYKFLGKLNRCFYKGPAYIGKENNTSIISYYVYGRLHRKGNNPHAKGAINHKTSGPCLIRYLPAAISYEYRRGGKLHNDCGPAILMISKSNKQVLFEEWYINGYRMKDPYLTIRQGKQPSSIIYHDDGTVFEEVYTYPKGIKKFDDIDLC